MRERWSREPPRAIMRRCLALPMAAICLRWVASKTSLVTALLPFPLQHLLNPAAIGARGIRRRPN